MALIITISLVALLVLVRLLMPPIPGLVKNAVERLGMRSTITLCAVALVGAVLVILISRN